MTIRKVWPDMQHGYWSSLRAECYVALHSKSTYLLLLAPAGIAAIGLFFSKLGNLQQMAEATALGQDLSYELETATAYGYLVDSFCRGINALALLFLAYATWSLAHGCTTGVVRHNITLHSSRSALLLTKLTTVHILALVALLVLLVCAYTITGLMWDYGPVVDEGYEIISEAESIDVIVQGLLLAALPLPATLAFGILVGAVVHAPVRAIAITVIGFVAFDLLKADLGMSANYLFLSFLPSFMDQSHLNAVGQLVRGFADVYLDDHVTQLNLWLPLPQMAILTALSWITFKRVSL